MRQKDHWKYETINWETFTIIINPCWHSFWEGVQLWPRLGVLSVFGFWDSRVLPFIIAWVPFLFRNLKPIRRQEWSLLLVVWGSCRTTTIRGRSWKIFGCHVGSSVEDYRRKVKATANLYTQGDKIAMWLPKRSWSESWLQMWWCMDMYGITLIYKCIVGRFANGISMICFSQPLCSTLLCSDNWWQFWEFVTCEFISHFRHLISLCFLLMFIKETDGQMYQSSAGCMPRWITASNAEVTSLAVWWAKM